MTVPPFMYGIDKLCPWLPACVPPCAPVSVYQFRQYIALKYIEIHAYSDGIFILQSIINSCTFPAAIRFLNTAVYTYWIGSCICNTFNISSQAFAGAKWPVYPRTCYVWTHESPKIARFVTKIPNSNFFLYEYCISCSHKIVPIIFLVN